MDDAHLFCLKDALANQYIVMKKLYAELEEEREASATAATEALSMILRLQREKAAEKMEACQYKRIAEEKMQHAEECLTILKEVTLQKEMEVTTLQCQLEAYKQKLSSMGVKIPDVREMGIYNSQLFRGTNLVPRDNNSRSHRSIRRNFSSPSLVSAEKLCFEMDLSSNYEDNNLLHPRRRSIWREVSQKYHGSCDNKESCSELTKKEKKPSIIQAEKAKTVESESSIVCREFVSPPFISGGSPRNLPTLGTRRKFDEAAGLETISKSAGSRNIVLELQHDQFDYTHSSCSESESNRKSVHSPGAHDIYEVPECHKEEGRSTGGPCEKELAEITPKTKYATAEMFNLVPEETVKHVFGNDDRSSNAFATGTHHRGSKLSRPSKSYFLHHGRNFSMPSGRIGRPRYGDPITGSSAATCQIEFEQLKRHLKQLEDEHIAIQKDTERGKEQMKLFREIFKQLNTIETQITSSSVKGITKDDSKVVSVMEAVLSFSI